jgi:hypothetical protein
MFKKPYTFLVDNDHVIAIVPCKALGKLYVVRTGSWGFYARDQIKPLIHLGRGIYEANQENTRIIWGNEIPYILLQKGERVKLFEDGSFTLLKKKK